MKKKLPKIGHEFDQGLAQQWNPRTQRVPMLSDRLVPPSDIPSAKPKKRSMPEIKALVQEMVDQFGECPAVEAYERKMYEESGFAVPPKKMTDEEWDKLLGGD